MIVAGDILEHVVDPETLLEDLRDHFGRAARSWCPCRTSPTGTRAAGSPSAGSTTTSAASSTTPTCASSPAGRFERLVNECGLHIAERDVVGSPVDVLDRGGETFVSRAARGVARVDRAATAAWPTMFGYQFLYRLEPI